MPLTKAPAGEALVLVDLGKSMLSRRLARMGLAPGERLTMMDEEAASGPVRIKGPHGAVVLASGMAAKVIVHHDDGHKTPVMEMHPGETGHVEGLVCGSSLECGLAVLGISENDPVKMVRRLPPMEYQALVQGMRHKLTEGVAAKIWGEMDGRKMQFAAAGTNRQFLVRSIIGGRRSVKFLAQKGIKPGSIMVLEKVSPASCMDSGCGGKIVIVADSGLRLYLRPDQAETILVRIAEP